MITHHVKCLDHVDPRRSVDRRHCIHRRACSPGNLAFVIFFQHKEVEIDWEKMQVHRHRSWRRRCPIVEFPFPVCMKGLLRQLLRGGRLREDPVCVPAERVFAVKHRVCAQDGARFLPLPGQRCVCGGGHRQHGAAPAAERATRDTAAKTQRNKRSYAHTAERPDTFNDKQSQIAERKTGNGQGPGNHSREVV